MLTFASFAAIVVHPPIGSPYVMLMGFGGNGLSSVAKYKTLMICPCMYVCPGVQPGLNTVIVGGLSPEHVMLKV